MKIIQYRLCLKLFSLILSESQIKNSGSLATCLEGKKSGSKAT